MKIFSRGRRPTFDDIVLEVAQSMGWTARWAEESETLLAVTTPGRPELSIGMTPLRRMANVGALRNGPEVRTDIGRYLKTCAAKFGEQRLVEALSWNQAHPLLRTRLYSNGSTDFDEALRLIHGVLI